MNETERKLALRQAKGKHQVAYVKQLLRGPVKLGGFWDPDPFAETGIRWNSRAALDSRLRTAGFKFFSFDLKNGNRYMELLPPNKNR